jgi:hypothetical protein
MIRNRESVTFASTKALLDRFSDFLEVKQTMWQHKAVLKSPQMASAIDFGRAIPEDAMARPTNKGV